MPVTYAIGDVHGCSDLLERLLTRIGAELRPEDTVVFLGDYIDRGPDSRGVIDAVLRFRTAHPDTITLKGNREQWLLEALADPRRTSWLVVGHAPTHTLDARFRGRPLLTPRVIVVDTGAHETGQLGAVRLPERVVFLS